MTPEGYQYLRQCRFKLEYERIRPALSSTLKPDRELVSRTVPSHKKQTLKNLITDSGLILLTVLEDMLASFV